MITAIKPLTVVHESDDNICECTLQQRKVVLATTIPTTEQFEEKIPDWGAAVHHSSHRLKCHKIFFHMPWKLPNTSTFLLEIDACTKSALHTIWQYSWDEQNA